MSAPCIATMMRQACYSLLACTALAATAAAQEKPRSNEPEEHLQEVVVTGSRIARPDLDAPSPVLVISFKPND